MPHPTFHPPELLEIGGTQLPEVVKRRFSLGYDIGGQGIAFDKVIYVECWWRWGPGSVPKEISFEVTVVPLPQDEKPNLQTQRVTLSKTAPEGVLMFDFSDKPTPCQQYFVLLDSGREHTAEWTRDNNSFPVDPTKVTLPR